MLNEWQERLNGEELKRKVLRINKDIQEDGLLRMDNSRPKSPRLLTGYSYGEVYDWDLYFENIYMSYLGVANYCRNNVEAFLDQQFPSGFVARTLKEPRLRQHFKPFLAQIVLLGMKQGQNINWLKGKYYECLKKYLDYWFWYLDCDRNGLPIWDSADHSGMDNQNLRGGTLYSEYCEGVDLASYLYRELKAMCVLAELLGEQEDMIAYEKHAEELKSIVNELLWDEEDGFYYDRNERTGDLIKYKSASSFAVLWAGIATPERAKILIEKHIMNSEEFWLEYPVASWAKNEEGYYQQRKGGECTWMGACWIPINYMLMHGLFDYGYKDLAIELSVKTFDMVFNEDEIREYYNAETGVGQGLNPFFGWSTLGLFMPFEMLENYDPTQISMEETKKIIVDKLNITF
ncbi:MAG: trehalase family glycosidase [Lachnospiraceae bacterium]